jgi:Protein of unknown function (DUF2934)
MNATSVILEGRSPADGHRQAPSKTLEHPAPNHPTLNEIQIRAYKIHQRHGGYYGGYSLDDWLEAEHELDDELHNADEPQRGEKRRGAVRTKLVQ